MNTEQRQAYGWAKTHDYPSIAARYARALASAVDDLQAQLLESQRREQAARTKLRDHLAAHVPEKRYTGAVQLVVKWCFPLAGDHYDGEYKTSKPDTDNLQKLLKDVMTDLGFWKDDALVASEIAEKFWAAIPGLYIAIGRLEPCPTT